MRPIEMMRAHAEGMLREFGECLETQQSRDVLDLLAVLEAADGLAEALVELPKLLEADNRFATAREVRNRIARYAAAKGKVTK